MGYRKKMAVKTFEKSFWLANGLKVTCSTTGLLGEEGSHNGHMTFGFTDLNGTDFDVSVSRYDNGRNKGKVRDVWIMVDGDSANQTFVDALDFIAKKMRISLFGENDAREEYVSTEMNVVLQALAEYCNVMSDVDTEYSLPDINVVGVKGLLEGIKKNIMEGDISLFKKEEIIGFAKECGFSQNNVDFLGNIKETILGLVKVIYQQSVLIKTLKRLPIDILFEENKIFREWMREHLSDNSESICGLSSVSSENSVAFAVEKAKEDVKKNEQSVVIEQPSEELIKQTSELFMDSLNNKQRFSINRRKDPNYKSIIQLITDVLPEFGSPFRGLTSNEIADKINKQRSSISSSLTAMRRQGKIGCWVRTIEIKGYKKETNVYFKPPTSKIEEAVLDFMESVKNQYPFMYLTVDHIGCALAGKRGSIQNVLNELLDKGNIRKLPVYENEKYRYEFVKR